MNRINNITIPITAFLIGLITASTVSAQTVTNDVASTINTANELVRSGEFEQGIEVYKAVAPTGAIRDELNYNSAVAHYKNGDIDAAERLFTSASSSSDTTVAAESRYNLGNCAYTKALQAMEQDREAAKHHLEQAISHYRSSLRLNSDNADARANIELAAKLMRDIEQQEKEEQQQQNEQQNQEQQNQDQQDSEQQEPEQSQSDQRQNDSEESQNQDSQSNDQQSDSESSENQESDSNEDQQNDQQQDEQQSQANEPSESEDNSKQEGSENENADQQDETKQGEETEQENPEQNPAGENTNAANDTNPRRQQTTNDQNEVTGEQSEAEGADEETQEQSEVPTGDLTAADQQNDGQKPESSAVMGTDNHNGEMSKEEALKLLQSVRDRDMLRRLRQQQIEKSRRRPVDRDW